ncbi:MAG: hypothetical protein LBK62_11385 [Treponema sp.]|jgi:hypothetical protein|nr:hypothetical protein [Treponema sp.]
MADNSIICKSRAAAFAGLETMASGMPRGTQRDTLIAIKNWMEKNLPPEFDERTRARLREIFEGTGEQKKGRAWLEREMSDPSYEGSTEGGINHQHHEMIHEPEDGAELDCFWNAKYKVWEPIGYGWPGVSHQTSPDDKVTG